MMANRTFSFSDSSTSSTRESSQGANLCPLLSAPRPHPCNSTRPTCSQCRAKHIDCVYRQTPEGTIHNPSFARQNKKSSTKTHQLHLHRI
ncbi:Uncharacterized protein HZ326_26798 [Fusarium oxysporum f. sp. albedinis]|nr:Uncharacterized protein HZ326_26798 [Fusarium oxysporum f. sp. albedinis]